MNFEERTAAETLCIDLRTLERALKIESYCLNQMIYSEDVTSYARTMNDLITLFFDTNIRPGYKELDAFVDGRRDEK